MKGAQPKAQPKTAPKRNDASTLEQSKKTNAVDWTWSGTAVTLFLGGPEPPTTSEGLLVHAPVPI